MFIVMASSTEKKSSKTSGLEWLNVGNLKKGRRVGEVVNYKESQNNLIFYTKQLQMLNLS